MAPLASSDEGIGMWSADGSGRMEYVVPTAPPMYDVKCSDVQELGSSSPWPAITPGCQPFAGTRSAAVAATRPQGQFSSLQSAQHWDPSLLKQPAAMLNAQMARRCPTPQRVHTRPQRTSVEPEPHLSRPPDSVTGPCTRPFV